MDLTTHSDSDEDYEETEEQEKVKEPNSEDEDGMPFSLNAAWDSKYIKKVFSDKGKSWNCLHCGGEGVIGSQVHQGSLSSHGYWERQQTLWGEMSPKWRQLYFDILRKKDNDSSCREKMKTIFNFLWQTRMK
jgi:hypothetical protein